MNEAIDSLQETIGAALRREAATATGTDLGMPTRATRLADTGLDSIGFATLIVELEEGLGIDPFAVSGDIVYPDTFGELVDLYAGASR